MIKRKSGMPRIQSTDLYSIIAKHSSLTVRQVRECFDVYHDVVSGLAGDAFKTNTNFYIPLPKIGWFYFKDYKGQKKGSTYCLPRKHEDGSWTREEVVLEEDRPSFQLLEFTFNRGLQKRIKAKSVDANEERQKNSEQG